jgi:hypothetical protein
LGDGLHVSGLGKERPVPWKSNVSFSLFGRLGVVLLFVRFQPDAARCCPILPANLTAQQSSKMMCRNGPYAISVCTGIAPFLPHEIYAKLHRLLN